MERRLAAILAADVVGYSRLMGKDEAGVLTAIKSIRTELIEPKAAQYGGRIIKLIGDGILMEFASVVDAVGFAVDVQTALRERNSGVQPGRQIDYRIGVNLGDVIVESDDIYGDGVNVAARLEGLAEPGGICVRRNVRNQVRDKLDLTFEDLGEVEVKNIARPMRVFRILMDEKADALSTPVAHVAGQTKKGARIAILAIVGVAVLMAAGTVLWWQSWPAGTAPTSQEAVTPPLSDKPTIAVLPFENLSKDSDEEYFADGMTDDLITNLSKVSGLFVISRNSVFAFKGQTVNLQKVGRELGVRFLLNGSVRRAGDRVRVNAQLIEASSGHNLWAERYDRDRADVFAVQDEVIERIVLALSVRLTQSEQTQLERPPTNNLKAYDHYLRAEQFYHTGGIAAVRESLRAYEAAIAEDPGFAKALARYARAASDVWRLDYISVMPGPIARETADKAARKAIKLDPNNSDAYNVIALSKMVAGDHTAAVDDARRAVYLGRNNADALLTLAIVLTYAGRHSEALEAAGTAIRLNPKAPLHFVAYHGLTLVMNGQYERAIEVMEPFRNRKSITPTLGDSLSEILAMAYVLAGREAEAHSVVGDIIRLSSFTNLNYYRVLYEHHKRQQDLSFRIDALRQAGVPEWPYGYRDLPENRLSAGEITALSTKGTWKGWGTSRGLQFTREASVNGEFVFANAETLMTGTAGLQEDMLCERYEIMLMSRAQCGYVYRNPDGTPEELNEYIYVTPITILRFSVVN